jgi:hypothetical protein
MDKIKKIENVMEALETSLQGIKRDIGECDKVYLHISKALFAFNQVKQILQEKLEREEGCEYCDFSSGDVGATINNVGDDFMLIKSENDISLASDNKEFNLLKINYCPNCGRKLDWEAKNDKI